MLTLSVHAYAVPPEAVKLQTRVEKSVTLADTFKLNTFPCFTISQEWELSAFRTNQEKSANIVHIFLKVQDQTKGQFILASIGNIFC